MVDQLVCFNEHNETSKGNEKHQVPSSQWYFKGTVCSETLVPAPTLQISHVQLRLRV